MSDSPWAPLEEVLRNIPSKPPEPMAPISAQDVADAARSVSNDYNLIGTRTADAIALAFKKFADKIDSLP